MGGVGKSGSMDPETKSSSKSGAEKMTSPDQDQPAIHTEPTQSASPLVPSPLPAQQESTVLPTTQPELTDKAAQERKKLWAKVMGTVALVVRCIILGIACGVHGSRIAYCEAYSSQCGGDSSAVEIALLTLRIVFRVFEFLPELVVELLGLWVPCCRLCLRITSLVLLSVAALGTLFFISYMIYWCIREGIHGSELNEWKRILALDGLNVLAITIEIVAFSVLVHSPRPKARLQPLSDPTQPSPLSASQPPSYPPQTVPQSSQSDSQPQQSFPQPQQPPSV